MIAGDNQGNLFSSYPLSDDGNYKFWAFSDPYKATVMKNDGTEVEEDIYEAYNISLLLANQKGSIAEGHGIRLNGEKYMHLKVRSVCAARHRVTGGCASSSHASLPPHPPGLER